MPPFNGRGITAVGSPLDTLGEGESLVLWSPSDIPDEGKGDHCCGEPPDSPCEGHTGEPHRRLPISPQGRWRCCSEQPSDTSPKEGCWEQPHRHLFLPKNRLLGKPLTQQPFVARKHGDAATTFKSKGPSLPVPPQREEVRPLVMGISCSRTLMLIL